MPKELGPDGTTRRTRTPSSDVRGGASSIRSAAETISDVDTKAVQTVRITVVLAGILVSAWKIDSGLFDPVLAVLGGLALVGSLTAGTFTYSESDLYLGPNKEYIEQLTDGDFDERQWKQDLLYCFGVWVSENTKQVRLNGHLLLTTQILLVVGIVFTGLSVLL
ncbi:hypothetical protein [Halorussus amylolyticus]|uniref:hypothetical protein n=1 Tax=Halorussus amylolyticus TaxID=1126242 RepID=UPI001043DBBD|nr:hypothetical protein [Halorussus amylolyticus]